eukprot:1526337-Pleurochrysis_carterae.AAC.2
MHDRFQRYEAKPSRRVRASVLAKRRKHTGAETYTRAGARPHTHKLAHSHTRTLARSHTRTLARSHTRTLAHSHTRTLAHSHARTLADSHMRTLAHSNMRTLAQSYYGTIAHIQVYACTCACTRLLQNTLILLFMRVGIQLSPRRGKTLAIVLFFVAGCVLTARGADEYNGCSSPTKTSQSFLLQLGGE